MCFIDISRRYLCCCYYLIGSVHCPMCLIPKLCLPTCPYYGCLRVCCGYISTIYSSFVVVITFFIFPLFFQPLLQLSLSQQISYCHPPIHSQRTAILPSRKNP